MFTPSAAIPLALHKSTPAALPCPPWAPAQPEPRTGQPRQPGTVQGTSGTKTRMAGRDPPAEGFAGPFLPRPLRSAVPRAGSQGRDGSGPSPRGALLRMLLLLVLISAARPRCPHPSRAEPSPARPPGPSRSPRYLRPARLAPPPAPAAHPAAR